MQKRYAFLPLLPQEGDLARRNCASKSLISRGPQANPGLPGKWALKQCIIIIIITIIMIIIVVVVDAS